MTTTWSGYRIDPERYPLDFALCGTSGNYRAHLRRGEKPCRSCRQAESRRQKDKPSQRPSRWAREKIYRARRLAERNAMTEQK